jgi:arylsulfatase A-like enzyme
VAEQGQGNGTRSGRRAFLMVWDGLRPDYITEAITPNLHRLAAAGVRFTNSHAVFPTVTRCNSSSIATGVLPGGHGIPSNMFYSTLAAPEAPLNAGLATDLDKLRPVRDGRVLLRPALGEYVANAGGRTAVVSTGSPGSCLLQHPQARECGDIMVHPSMQTGVTLAELADKVGVMPPKTMPNTAQNAWATRLITDWLLPEVSPRLIQFWHTDPDHTQHEHGIGHPETLRSLRDADDNLGAVLAALDRLGLAGETDVIVTSDHGFSTISGRADLRGALIEAGLKQDEFSTDVLMLGDMIYVPSGDPDRIAAVVRLLQSHEAIGTIFTGTRGNPVLPGTCALTDAGAEGECGPDILFSAAWSDEENPHGYRGTSWSVFPFGTKAASHGCISPWDVHNSLVAAGPSFKAGIVSDIPAGNIDIAPTLLRLLGLAADGGFDGRVLDEALVAGPEPAAVTVERETLVQETNAGRQTVQFSTVGRTRYLDFGTAER